jgi:hypothetical protein
MTVSPSTSSGPRLLPKNSATEHFFAVCERPTSRSFFLVNT